MYSITLNIHVEDLTAILQKNPLMTLKDKESEKCYDKDSENIEDFLDSSSMKFNLVYDVKSIAKLKRIDDTFQAIILLNSDYFNQLHMINRKVSNDKIFLRHVIAHPRWNGSCKSFGSEAMNDRDFLLEVIKNERWNGSSQYFSDEVMKDEDFVKELASTERWNGELRRLSQSYSKSQSQNNHIIQSFKQKVKSMMRTRTTSTSTSTDQRDQASDRLVEEGPKGTSE